MKLYLLIFLLLPAGTVFSQKIHNEFFALHNIIRGDSTYDTFEKQVRLLKDAGFDGVEINQLESLGGMKQALDKFHFKGSYFYVRLDLQQPDPDLRLQTAIQLLKGSGTLISPYLITGNRGQAPDPDTDSLAVKRLRLIADWAEAAGLSVAVYPHLGYYVEHTRHALALVRRVNRPNTGLAFNLCHWLATTPKEERGTLRTELKTLFPYLRMVTVCGANDVQSTRKNVWQDYILPLGSGSFDTYGLLRYLIKDLGFSGPIGVQCYNIAGDKLALIQSTMRTWTRYKSQLESRK